MRSWLLRCCGRPGAVHTLQSGDELRSLCANDMPLHIAGGTFAGKSDCVHKVRREGVSRAHSAATLPVLRAPRDPICALVLSKNMPVCKLTPCFLVVCGRVHDLSLSQITRKVRSSLSWAADVLHCIKSVCGECRCTRSVTSCTAPCLTALWRSPRVGDGMASEVLWPRLHYTLQQTVLAATVLQSNAASLCQHASTRQLQRNQPCVPL